MDNSPEAKNVEAQNQEQAKFQQFMDKFNEVLTEKIIAIESSNKPQEQKDQEKAELGTRFVNELRQSFKNQEKIQQDLQQGRSVSADQQQKASEDVHKKLIQVVVAADKDLNIVRDKKAQGLLKELIKTKPNEVQAVEMMNYLGPWITGEQTIVFGKSGEKSDFQKAVDQLAVKDNEAAKKIIDSMAARPSDYGFDEAKEIRKQFKTPEVKSESEVKEPVAGNEDTRYEAIRDAMFERDQNEYYGRFTQDQQEFIRNLYSPAKFTRYVENQINNPEGEKLKNEYKKGIKHIYQEQKKDIPSEPELDKLVDNRWRQQVSQNIEIKLGDVLNQLLLRLQQEGGNKFYDELAQEDFMRGIRATENQIRNALITLQSSLAQSEESLKDPNLKLYKFFDRGHYLDEREKEIDPITGEKRDMPYWRLYPLLQPKEINLKDFALQLSFDMDHILGQKNYLHDARVVFNHQPGEHGFYKGLGGYAEKYKGTDIDEMMLLPDGNLSLEAFHLYEKYLEEDFASLDWKHRPTEFTNELEYVNSQLEREIIAQMKLEYGDNVSDERIKAAVNIGVGLARGVFLTEPEKSAYADPVDNEGRGMVASYGTNDAGALNALNPLHVELRWQGEHHMFMYYFMPIGGEKGPWDHKKMWDNMGNYLDSYTKGNAKLPKHLFIDEMNGVTKAGGIFTRKGWRMQASLEGHFHYNKDGSVNAIESFKAMDYIGYEAVADFLGKAKMGEEILKAKEGTSGAKQRKEFFQYVYEKYFKEFDGADFSGYMADLRKLGEEQALKTIKNEKTAPAGSWEEQVELETSKIFLDRAIVREIALRFPSKFLRIDRGRFEEDGISRWHKIQKELNMGRDDFNAAMKDFIFTETLLRKEISQMIKDQLRLDPTLDLNKVNVDYKSLNEATIERLLKKTEGKDKNGNLLMTPERIENVKRIYRAIRKDFLNGEFLNGKAISAVKDYPYSFGVEDTDLGLMAFRGTGPRMVARSINDTGILEEGAIPAISRLGRTLQQMAIDGKHDFSPIIEAMVKARQAFNDVHGTGDDQKFNYNLATAVIQYFKKDTMAKPLFGLLRIGRRNSIAAEYAGRSSAVWEWDSRDIDRFCTALESYRILPRTAFDFFEVRKKGGEMENVYWKIGNKAYKTPFKKQKVHFKYNAARLRKEFGGDIKSIIFDTIDNFLPIIFAIIMWQYFKKALEEASGGNKK